MKTRIFTQNRIEAKRTFEHIQGKCLEKLGLRFTNGSGYAVLDCTIKPKIGDLVHCDNNFGTIHGFIKQIRDIKDGVYIVGTAYEDGTKDFEFEASIIYGVVTYVFDAFNHNQLYERTIESEGEENKRLEAQIDPFPFCSISGCEGVYSGCHKTCPNGLVNKIKIETVREMQTAIHEYYDRPCYQPTKKMPIKHTEVQFMLSIIDKIAKETLEGISDV